MALGKKKRVPREVCEHEKKHPKLQTKKRMKMGFCHDINFVFVFNRFLLEGFCKNQAASCVRESEPESKVPSLEMYPVCFCESLTEELPSQLSMQMLFLMSP